MRSLDLRFSAVRTTALTVWCMQWALVCSTILLLDTNHLIPPLGISRVCACACIAMLARFGCYSAGAVRT